MDTAFNDILNLVLTHSYLFIFVMMVLEGPVVTFAAAFAASQGYLNIWLVLLISLVGDLAGDVFYYWLGRLGRHTLVERFGYRVGLTPERLRNIENHLYTHSTKTIIAMKLTPVLSGPGLMIAGASRISFLKYFSTCCAVIIPNSLFFVGMGYLFGSTYEKIFKYYNIFGIALVFAIIAAAIFYGYKIFVARLSHKIENLDQ